MYYYDVTTPEQLDQHLDFLKTRARYHGIEINYENRSQGDVVVSWESSRGKIYISKRLLNLL